MPSGEGEVDSGTVHGAGSVHWHGGELEFDQFLELIPDAVVVVDRAGKIVLANHQAEGLFGYTGDELVGLSIEDLVPERFRDGHAAHRQKYLKEARMRPMGIGLELYGRRRDGSEFPTDISLSSIQTAEGVITAAAVRDLTERAEAERERRALEAVARDARSQQARRLESIGELAGGIAHDFNNLLAVIMNNTELALEDIPGGGDLEEELREIYGAAEHASRLTSQLLVFSRRQTTETEPVNFNEIVSDMERLLRRTIGEQIKMEVRLADDLPMVAANPSQLEQVVLNLAINARDAMPRGGSLGIETSLVNLDSEYAGNRPDIEPGEHVRLTVADGGMGMSREVVERAFEPFFTTKEKGQGTGMGLATVYGIVKQAGGHVSIYSEPGGGTVVRIDLPAPSDIGSEHGTSEQEYPDDSGNGQTVLVVEDSNGVRRSVCKILARAGYRVLDTDRGSEALRICVDAEEHVSLVITDVVMPNMSGIDLADQLRASRPDLPIVYMSGYADVNSPLGAEAVLLEKPFTGKALLNRVAEAFERDSGKADG